MSTLAAPIPAANSPRSIHHRGRSCRRPFGSLRSGKSLRLLALVAVLAAGSSALGCCRSATIAAIGAEDGAASLFVSFVAAPGSPHRVGPNVGAIRVIDVTGDGLEDLVATCGGEANDESTKPSGGFVHLLVGDGRGGFRPLGPPLSIGFHGVQADAGDFDGDGRLDVLTTNSDDDTVSVLLGAGAGGFEPARGSPLPAGRHPYESLRVVDVNGDGRVDLAVPNLHGRAVTVLLGDGAGEFRPAPGSPFAVGDRPGFLATGDVDGDGRPDVVVTHDDDPIVWVLRNAGDGRFEPFAGSPIELTETVWGALVADMDGDGRSDLVLGARGEHVLLLLGDGAGRFGDGRNPVRVPVDGRGPGNVAVGDFDRDGKLDVVTGNYESGNVSVRLRR